MNGSVRNVRFEEPLCAVCLRMLSDPAEPGGTGVCSAYLSGIPAGIWFSSKGHYEPVPGDGGEQFIPRKEWKHYGDPDYINQKFDEARKELKKLYGGGA